MGRTLTPTCAEIVQLGAQRARKQACHGARRRQRVCAAAAAAAAGARGGGAGASHGSSGRGPARDRAAAAAELCEAARAEHGGRAQDG